SVRRLIDTVSPGTLLSADVGADVNSAPRTIYQDYGLWLKLGLIDLLHPMTYGGTDSFREWVKNVMDVSCGVPVAPGTGIYIDGITAGDMADQVQAARELGCVGVVHFQINSYLGKSCGTLLTASAYGTDSRAPGRDALGACGTAIDVFLRRAALHSDSAGVPTAAELESLRDAADDLRSRLTAPDPDISALKTLLSSIDSAHAGSQRGLFSLLSADLLRLERLMTFLRPAPESYVTVPRGTAVSAYLESEHLTGLFLRSGYAASDDVPVATGMYYEAEGVRRTAVVLGDTSGDGRITSSDYLRCKRHVLRTAYLTGPFEEAAKLSGKQAVGANDYLQIKRHVLRLYTIRDR
ncbi:MAG: hypothetical protein ILO68_00770, partial [Clostridia bacterium]|nr:hypothetical protein [Clostridia bacterium]